jgi:hypothetical protein
MSGARLQPRDLVRAAGLAALACLAGPAAGAESGTAASVSGVIEVLVEEDFATGRSRLLHWLHEDATGRSLRLEPQDGLLPPLLSGARVTAHGVAVGDALVLRGGPEGAPLTVLEAAAAIGGPRKAVVLLVDFANAAVACAGSAVAGLMFTDAQSVDGLYRESSFDAVSFPGDTDSNGQPDVFRVAISATTAESCNPYGWASAADSAAQAAGVNLGPYQHRVYVLPANQPCSWAGLANLGCGGTCRSWIGNCNLADVYAHELGHNLGMAHASTDPGHDGAIDCEYCDTSDFMGYGGIGWRQVNGPHKMQMGWLPAQQQVGVAPGGPTTYTLSALEADPDLAPFPQVLRIPRPASGDYYYVSYPTRTGYNAALSNQYAYRTNVHTWPGSGSSNTLFVQALPDAQSFADAGLQLTITQLAHDATTATVRVTLGPVVPPPAPSGLQVQ